MADDTHKMLQLVLEGQGAIRSDIKNLDEKLTKRIDRIGLDVARLQDDAPTIEEFDKLEKRVKNVEVKVAGKIN